MTYQIVQINVSQTIGAVPDGLQQRGAVLSFGATTHPAGVPILLVDRGEINDYVRNGISAYQATYTPAQADGGGGGGGGTREGEEEEEPQKVSAKVARSTRAAQAAAARAVRADGSTTFLLTVTPDSTISQAINSTVNISVRDCVPTTFNGDFEATVVSSTQLQWTVQGLEQTGVPNTIGYYTIEGSSLVSAALTSFFAQGTGVGVYLLEMGAQEDVNTEIAQLADYVGDPLLRMYTYTVPTSWDGNADFIQLAKNYEANDAMVYFLIQTRGAESTGYTSPYRTIKSVIAVTDETYPVTNQAGGFMYLINSADPSVINKVAPFAFRYVNGATPSTLKDSYTEAMRGQYVNWIQSGAEGGISRNIWAMGVSSDGYDFLYWYAVDWVQINAHIALANTVINGSNNPINPLYYDQDGIDRLQLSAQGVFNSGVSFGLVLGAATVEAVSFRDYVQLQPNDYAAGRYAGLSAEFTPNKGFTRIVFNINVNINPVAAAIDAQG